ncbi:recombinase family protein [Actinocorallia sp. B10E7]|uniref:recombinase family protein n=1 Tax=Actinocorallia sp. B10E7 TaxID=3153558 RepID=UPI00325DAF30
MDMEDNGPGAVLYGPEAERLRNWAAAEGIPVVAEFGDETGDDGSSPVRRGLLGALSVVRRRAADVVVVRDVEVVGSTVAAQEAFRAELARAGGDLAELDPPSAAAPVEPRAFARAYELVRREWERAEISDRLQDGRRRRRETDPTWWPGGRAPLGYELDAGRIVESAREMAVVTRIKELRRTGSTLGEIAAALTAERYTTKEGRTTWYREQVRRVLVRHGEPTDDEPDVTSEVE